MDNHIEDFIEDLEYRNFSKETIYTYKRVLLNFQDYTGTNWEDLHPREIKKYLNMMKKERNCTAKYILKISSTLSSFYQFLIKDDVLDHNPIEKIDKPKVEMRAPVYLNNDELNRLMIEITKVNPTILERRNYVIINLMYYCGLRISELINIDIKDLKEDGNKTVLRVVGKGNKERFVPVNPKLKAILDSWMQFRPSIKGCEALVVSSKGRMKKRSIQKMFKQVVTKMGMEKNITPHKLRHTFATELLNKGANIAEIQKLLGHSNINTTMVYAHVENASLQTAIDRL